MSLIIVEHRKWRRRRPRQSVNLLSIRSAFTLLLVIIIICCYFVTVEKIKCELLTNVSNRELSGNNTTVPVVITKQRQQQLLIENIFQGFNDDSNQIPPNLLQDKPSTDYVSFSGDSLFESRSRIRFGKKSEIEERSRISTHTYHDDADDIPFQKIYRQEPKRSKRQIIVKRNSNVAFDDDVDDDKKEDISTEDNNKFSDDDDDNQYRELRRASKRRRLDTNSASSRSTRYRRNGLSHNRRGRRLTSGDEGAGQRVPLNVEEDDEELLTSTSINEQEFSGKFFVIQLFVCYKTKKRKVVILRRREHLKLIIIVIIAGLMKQKTRNLCYLDT